MTESKGKKSNFTGCCFESDFKFPMGKAEEMSEIMKIAAQRAALLTESR